MMDVDELIDADAPRPLDRRAALVRVQDARARGPPRARGRASSTREPEPQLVARARRGRVRRRHARALPPAARPAARRRGLGRRGHRRRPATARSTTRWPTPRARGAWSSALARGTTHRAPRTATWRFHPVDGAAAGEALDPVRPIGVEQSNSLDGVRRRADPQGLPPHRAGPEPRARAAALPHRARLRAHRAGCAAGTSTTAGWSTRRSALLQEFLPGGARRLGRSCSTRSAPTAARRPRRPRARSARSPARMHTDARLATRTTRRSRPRSRAPRRSRCCSRRSTRTSRRSSATCPTTRGARADPPAAAQEVRDQLRGARRTPARAGADPHATATTTSARPCCTPRGWVVLDFEGEPARTLPRAPPEALAAARRRGDAALVRLRGLGVGAAARRAGARRTGSSARASAFLDAYFAAVDARLLPHGAAERPSGCCRSSSSRRRSTSCATS